MEKKELGFSTFNLLNEVLMKFSQELEFEFFARLLQDADYIESYSEQLKKYKGLSFPIEWIRIEILKWNKDYKGLPPNEYWAFKAENELQEDKRKIILSTVETLLNHEKKFEEFAKDQFIDFICSQSLEKSYEEGQSLFQRTLDVNLFFSKITEGLVDSERLRYGKNPDKVVDWLEQRPKRESRRGLISEGLKLGIPLLDDQLTFKRGTLSLFQGPYKRYKSIMLHHCGFAALLQGYNVLHVSYENTEQQVGDRYDSRFTMIDYKRMVRNLISIEEKELMETVFERLEKLPNRLKIQLCVPYEDNIDVVEKGIVKLKNVHSWAPDVVILDYINLPACKKKDIEDDYKRIELVCWDLQNLGKLKDMVMISACQSVKGAEDENDLKGSDTAGSVGILRACDNQIAINQTDEEFKQGIIRLSPLFFRDDELITKNIPMNHELTRMCVSRESDNLWRELEE